MYEEVEGAVLNLWMLNFGEASMRLVGIELSFFSDCKVIGMRECIVDTSPERIEVDVEQIEGGFIVPFHTIEAKVVRLGSSNVEARH